MTDKFVPTGYSHTIFRDRYAFTETETWAEACMRVAQQMSIAEVPEKQQQYREKFYSVLSSNLFVPGGRIWYNSGRTNPQLLNCFVLDPNKDSREGWGKSSYNMIVTSMTGGGCGDDFSDVRPRGASISGQKGVAPGAVELMRLIDNCADPVRNGGQRRVALMFSLDIDHPDVEEFLNAKLAKGELSHANVSVRSKRTKEFIRAVKNNGDWELNWKGKYKRIVKAKVLWDTIVANAYNSAEPGFLNWELVESESNIWYIEPLVTTNPCGEIALSAYDCCCLGHLVLTRFINGGQIDYALLGNTIRTAVRFLDNVLSVNSYPLPEMKAKSQALRRIGLGTTALADTLAILGLRYGSEEGNKFIDRLYRFISKAAYESSIMLAVEKGAFPLCNPDKHIESGFMKRMPAKIRSLVQEHGIRNCCILFAPAYERPYWDAGMRRTELVFHPLFEKFMNENKSVDHFVGSHELSVRDHMEVQKIVQRHVDNAVSKTINIAHDYPIEELEKAWLEYLPYLKGTTFYRDGTRGFVNEDGTVEPPPLSPIPIDDAKARLREAHKTEAENVDDCPNGVCTI